MFFGGIKLLNSRSDVILPHKEFTWTDLGGINTDIPPCRYAPEYQSIIMRSWAGVSRCLKCLKTLWHWVRGVLCMFFETEVSGPKCPITDFLCILRGNNVHVLQLLLEDCGKSPNLPQTQTELDAARDACLKIRPIVYRKYANQFALLFWHANLFSFVLYMTGAHLHCQSQAVSRSSFRLGEQ